MGKPEGQVKSSIRGVVKQAGQVLRGRSGIYATLSKEHGQVAALLSELVKTSNNEMSKRRELFDRIEEDLSAHSKAEDAVFYATLASDSRTQQEISHARNEHAEIDSILDEMSSSPVDQPAWLQLAERLKELVEHHVKEEEQKLFKQADDLLSSDDAELMDKQYKQRRDAEKRQTTII